MVLINRMLEIDVKLYVSGSDRGDIHLSHWWKARGWPLEWVYLIAGSLFDFSVVRAAACGQMTVQCVCGVVVVGTGEDRADLTVLFLKSPPLFT